MNRVDRRTFLIGSAAAGLVAACGGGDDRSDTAGGDGDTRSGDVEFLVPAFPVGYGSAPSMLVPGITQRIVFVVRDDLDILRDGAPDHIDVSVTLDGEPVVEGTYPAHRDGIITPYYPIVFTPPRAGDYRAEMAGPPPIDFRVEELSAVPIVQVGDQMRPVATPTFDDALGVDPICTRAVPCPYHQISLDDALESGKPTILLVATPGFCQTDICGPVVDLLIDAVGERDDLSVVHGEVYVDPTEFESGEFPDTTPVVDTYSLPYEPQLVVAEADGTIVARLDTLWDRAELDEALSAVL